MTKQKVVRLLDAWCRGDKAEQKETWEVLKQALGENIPCTWQYDEFHEKWDTSCENSHVFIAGNVKENSYEFCPYCGRRIQLE